MITAREAAQVLKGSAAEKRQLFDKLTHWAVVGELPAWGPSILEALKKDLMPEKKVVEMSATMKGVGGAGV